MTLSELQTDVRWKTRTTSSEYSDTDLNRELNKAYQILGSKILEAQDSWDFQGQIATANLVANQQQYTFPTDILKAKRADITFDGVSWHRVNVFDVSEAAEALDTTSIANNFNIEQPYVAMFRNSMFVYPAPPSNVTAGFKLWFTQALTLLSDPGDSPSIETAFHGGLSEMASKAYFDRKGFTVEGNMSQKNIDRIITDMQTFYGTRVQDELIGISTGSDLSKYT